ncbi:hypothetical protein [Haladaptatus salinisoli]|uniref:hypothetical protein n=1 Tax=Haladaptatus salinisoli TaxID=2884876 RepID=UPI001D0A0A6E|nr:hypothetical protein [Haladaptatus salinisoli]
MSALSAKLRISAFAVAVVVSAVAGVSVLVGPAVAAANASVAADSAIPGATATHRVTVCASADEVGNSLSSVRVNYHADGSYDGSVQDVGVDDVRRVGIDTDDDGDIEVSVADDLESVEAKNVGETLLFNFGGSYGLHAGDSVVVVFDDATNPTSAGEYTVEVDPNVQSSADPASTTLTVGTVANETLRSATWTNASVDGAVIENRTISDANRRGDGAKRSHTGRTTDGYRAEKLTRSRRNRGSEPQRCRNRSDFRPSTVERRGSAGTAETTLMPTPE